MYTDYYGRAFESPQSFIVEKVFSWSLSGTAHLGQSKGNSMQQVPKAARILVPTLSATNNSAGSRSCQRAPCSSYNPLRWFGCSCPAVFPRQQDRRELFPPSSPAPCCTCCLSPPLFSVKDKDPPPVENHSLVQWGFIQGHSWRSSCPMLPFHHSFSARGMWSPSELMPLHTDSKQEKRQTISLK